MHVDDASELLGINTRVELAAADGILRERKIREVMLAGVTVERPETVTIDAQVRVDPAGGRWSARFSRAERTLAEIKAAPSPKAGLEAVDWFGWTLDPRVASTLEITGVKLRRSAVFPSTE